MIVMRAVHQHTRGSTYLSSRLVRVWHERAVYLANSDSAKPESAVQESAKPYFAKPGNC